MMYLRAIQTSTEYRLGHSSGYPSAWAEGVCQCDTPPPFFVLPFRGLCKSPVWVQSFMGETLLSGKWLLINRFHLQKTVAMRRAALFSFAGGLFYRYRFCQVARAVHIAATQHGDMV